MNEYESTRSTLYMYCSSLTHLIFVFVILILPLCRSRLPAHLQFDVHFIHHCQGFALFIESTISFCYSINQSFVSRISNSVFIYLPNHISLTYFTYRAPPKVADEELFKKVRQQTKLRYGFIFFP